MPDESKPDPPSNFDPIKACFLLVAGILVVQAFVVLIGMSICWWHMIETNVVRKDCSENDKLWTLLQSMLSAALAFSGAFIRR